MFNPDNQYGLTKFISENSELKFKPMRDAIHSKVSSGAPVVMSIIASKGGVGKTTLSHAICQGAAMNGEVAVLISTDDQAIPVGDGSYAILDGRVIDEDTSRLVRVLEELAPLADKIDLIVIDGGANRKAFDKMVQKHSDVVLVPTKTDGLSISECLKSLDAFPGSYAVINEFSGNTYRRLKQQRRIHDKFENHFDRIAHIVPSVASFDDAIDDEIAKFTSSALPACKSLYFDMFKKFKK